MATDDPCSVVEDILLNLTSEDNGTMTSEFPLYIRVNVTVICVMILIVGVLGNLLVVIVVWKNQDMRNSTNYLLVNLSIADMLVLIVCLPTILVDINSQPEVWNMGQVMCTIVPFIEMTVAHGSALTILSISFERYYVICKPLKAGYKLTRMRAFVVICCLWLFALLVTSPVMLMTKYYYTQYHDGSLVPVCSTIVNDFWGTLYYVVITICCFILPLLILIMLYTVIVRKLITRPSPVRARVAANNKTRTRHQVVLMIGMVVLFFFITLLPFRIFVLWIVLDSTAPSNTLNMESYYNILYFCRIMCYINSTINPIIYNMTSTKFRQAFLRVLDVRKGGSRHQLSRQWTLTATLPSVNSSITFRAIERSCSSHVSRPSLTPNGDL